MKKPLKIFFILAGGLLVIFFALTLLLWIKSPGTAQAITDLNGKALPKSISTIEKVTLGGLEQYYMVRGADSTKPVMLFLHGGPGLPEMTFLKNSNPAIEKNFVMVYWEQRGAGKSYSKNISPQSMNLPQFISDTRELSEILARRFDQQKIYIMGHSWGSFLGILTAWQHPELFHAFIGVGQVCHQYKSEQISLRWAREQAHDRHCEKAVKALSKIQLPDSTADGKAWLNYLKVERTWVNKFGGGRTHKPSGLWPISKMVLTTEEYSLREKLSFLSGNLFSMEHLWPEIINRNLSNEIESMQIPVYIFHGQYDYQTSYSVAKAFFDQLKAPRKEFFTFENSAHSPLMEEVDKFNAIVNKIANTTESLQSQ